MNYAPNYAFKQLVPQEAGAVCLADVAAQILLTATLIVSFYDISLQTLVEITNIKIFDLELSYTTQCTRLNSPRQ